LANRYRWKIIGKGVARYQRSNACGHQVLVQLIFSEE
jgi:hypothetical protein